MRAPSLLPAHRMSLSLRSLATLVFLVPLWWLTTGFSLPHTVDRDPTLPAVELAGYRFVFEENSNFFVFADQAWWEDATQDQLVTDTPFGFGLGTTFETKAGLFSLTYALGRQFFNPIELRGGKVHFGFISLF